MTPALRAVALDAGYAQGRPCVRELTLEVGEGEILAVLGPNGAGKTTVLSTLAGLLPALSGDVEVAGTLVRHGSARAAARAGLVLVPDNRALFTQLTTEENIELAVGRGRRWRTGRDGVLDYLPELRNRLKVRAGDLSGGEQQMVAIARALVQHPRVLLVDELSMGLAPAIVKRLLPVLRSVADDRGTAIVLVEQHVQLALGVADTALVLAHGTDVLRGDADDLAADPARIAAAYLGGTAAPGDREVDGAAV